MVRASEGMVTMTGRAEQKMAEILRERGIATPMLRVFAQDGGGCAGVQFGMTIAEQQEAGDTVVSLATLTLIIDPQSAPLVDGAEIDFVEGPMSSGFTISNPNAAPPCACGAGGCGPGGPSPSSCC